MSFEEALQVLEVTTEVGAKGARRAYLRLLKRHKPERDPSGFRRLRDAYEAVQAQPWAFELAPEAGDGAEEAAADAAADANDTEAKRDAREASPAPSEGHGKLTPPSDRLADASGKRADGADAPTTEAAQPENLDDVHAELVVCEEDEERLQICRQALERFSDDPGAYLMLADEYEVQGRAEEAIAVLRQGESAGFPSLGRRVLEQWPQAATDAELADALEVDDIGTLQSVAEGALSRERFGDARRALRKALALMSEQELGVYVCRSQIDLTLRFYADSGDDDARAMLLDACRLVTETGLELQMSVFGDLWLFQVRELLNIWADLKAPHRRALCRLVSSSNADEDTLGTAEWQAFAADYGMRRAALRRKLAREAPALDAAVVEHLVPPLEETLTKSRTGRAPWWAIMMIAGALLRMFTHMLSDHEPDMPAEVAGPRKEEVALERFCELAPRPSCRIAQRFLEKLYEGDCSEVTDRLAALRRVVVVAPDQPELELRLEALAQAFYVYCEPWTEAGEHE